MLRSGLLRSKVNNKLKLLPNGFPHKPSISAAFNVVSCNIRRVSTNSDNEKRLLMNKLVESHQNDDIHCFSKLLLQHSQPVDLSVKLQPIFEYFLSNSASATGISDIPFAHWLRHLSIFGFVGTNPLHRPLYTYLLNLISYSESLTPEELRACLVGVHRSGLSWMDLDARFRSTVCEQIEYNLMVSSGEYSHKNFTEFMHIMTEAGIKWSDLPESTQSSLNYQLQVLFGSDTKLSVDNFLSLCELTRDIAVTHLTELRNIIFDNATNLMQFAMTTEDPQKGLDVTSITVSALSKLKDLKYSDFPVELQRALSSAVLSISFSTQMKSASLYANLLTSCDQLQVELTNQTFAQQSRPIHQVRSLSDLVVQVKHVRHYKDSLYTPQKTRTEKAEVTHTPRQATVSNIINEQLVTVTKPLPPVAVVSESTVNIAQSSAAGIVAPSTTKQSQVLTSTANNEVTDSPKHIASHANNVMKVVDHHNVSVPLVDTTSGGLLHSRLDELHLSPQIDMINLTTTRELQTAETIPVITVHMVNVFNQRIEYLDRHKRSSPDARWHNWPRWEETIDGLVSSPVRFQFKKFLSLLNIFQALDVRWKDLPVAMQSKMMTEFSDITKLSDPKLLEPFLSAVVSLDMPAGSISPCVECVLASCVKHLPYRMMGSVLDSLNRLGVGFDTLHFGVLQQITQRTAQSIEHHTLAELCRVMYSVSAMSRPVLEVVGDSSECRERVQLVNSLHERITSTLQRNHLAAMSAAGLDSATKQQLVEYFRGMSVSQECRLTALRVLSDVLPQYLQEFVATAEVPPVLKTHHVEVSPVEALQKMSSDTEVCDVVEIAAVPAVLLEPAVHITPLATDLISRSQNDTILPPPVDFTSNLSSKESVLAVASHSERTHDVVLSAQMHDSDALTTLSTTAALIQPGSGLTYIDYTNKLTDFAKSGGKWAEWPDRNELMDELCMCKNLRKSNAKLIVHSFASMDVQWSELSPPLQVKLSKALSVFPVLCNSSSPSNLLHSLHCMNVPTSVLPATASEALQKIEPDTIPVTETQIAQSAAAPALHIASPVAKTSKSDTKKSQISAPAKLSPEDIPPVDFHGNKKLPNRDSVLSAERNSPSPATGHSPVNTPWSSRIAAHLQTDLKPTSESMMDSIQPDIVSALTEVNQPAVSPAKQDADQLPAQINQKDSARMGHSIAQLMKLAASGGKWTDWKVGHKVMQQLSLEHVPFKPLQVVNTLNAFKALGVRWVDLSPPLQTKFSATFLTEPSLFKAAGGTKAIVDFLTGIESLQAPPSALSSTVTTALQEMLAETKSVPAVDSISSTVTPVKQNKASPVEASVSVKAQTKTPSLSPPNLPHVEFFGNKKTDNRDISSSTERGCHDSNSSLSRVSWSSRIAAHLQIDLKSDSEPMDSIQHENATAQSEMKQSPISPAKQGRTNDIFLTKGGTDLVFDGTLVKLKTSSFRASVPVEMQTKTTPRSPPSLPPVDFSRNGNSSSERGRSDNYDTTSKVTTTVTSVPWSSRIAAHLQQTGSTPTDSAVPTVKKVVKPVIAKVKTVKTVAPLVVEAAADVPSKVQIEHQQELTVTSVPQPTASVAVAELDPLVDISQVEIKERTEDQVISSSSSSDGASPPDVIDAVTGPAVEVLQPETATEEDRNVKPSWTGRLASFFK